VHRASFRAVRPVALALILVAAAACSSASPTDPGATASLGPGDPISLGPAPSVGPSAGPSSLSCPRPLRVGLVGQPGSLTDNGYNQSAVSGLAAASAAAPGCFSVDSVATKTVDDATSDLAAYASRGYDIVIGVGQALGDALGDAAAKNSGVRFIGVDTAPGPSHDATWNTNGQSLFFAEDEQGYLAGTLAALLSHNHNVGVVGGLLLVPQVEASVEGFLHGAAATVPGITVQFAYTTSFDDPAQGGAAARAMMAKGADVIFSTGSATGDGALQAACKAGVLAIGSDTDQALSLPAAAGCIVSSATKNIAAAVSAALLRIAAGSFTPGFHTDDAASGGIVMAPGHALSGDISTADQAQLDSTLQGLADGSNKPAVVIDGKTP
jgi:basic membrane lipoprotein Med (substrate-binding protein (PBP1-ABC) superfamily)